ncbi:MAG: PhnD/SsuA/transferrin family substrate-binding protein [Polymorphobacter sp.]|uniref:PhnD/SsuA/transferrin family substrate-binding protein n=1 Tax=Polymorphobacter sp. TaxID=1909290 RepID=UPI003A8660A0
MIRLATTLLAALLSAPLAAQDTSAPFRLLVPDAGLQGCAPSGDAEAYRAHLEARLARPVQLCGAESAAAAAAALNAGEAEMVLLDPPAFEAVKASARAILAGRRNAETGRTLTVALVPATSPRKTLADLAGAVPIMADEREASFAVPLQALADAGAPTASFQTPLVVRGDEAAFNALRAGRGDLLIVTASARQRACASPDIEVDPCADLREVWRGRPRAPHAFVVANAMPIDQRHQLVGIHVGLHFEAPRAMAFLARALPGAQALDPAEAGALR